MTQHMTQDIPSCREHIEIAIDDFVNQYELPPEIKLIEEQLAHQSATQTGESATATLANQDSSHDEPNCHYCANKAVYLITEAFANTP